MNEQALQAIVDKVVREIKAPQDMTLDIALSLAEKVKAKGEPTLIPGVLAWGWEAEAGANPSSSICKISIALSSNTQ